MGRFRDDKAPDVLVEALAPLGAPPPAYLVGAAADRSTYEPSQWLASRASSTFWRLPHRPTVTLLCRAAERGGLVSIAFGVVLGARPDIGAVTLALLFGLYRWHGPADVTDVGRRRSVMEIAGSWG